MSSNKCTDHSKLCLIIAFGLVCYAAVRHLATIPPRWYASNLLDGSWLYSLTRLRLDDSFLGKDIFFTYGPLSQYLGPMVVNGQLPDAPFYVVGILSMMCWGVAWFAILRQILPLNYFNSLFLLYAMYWVIQTGTFASISDVQAFGLIFLIYLAFYIEQEPLAKTFLYIGLVLATIIYTQIKFSLGFFAFCAMCVASIAMSKRFGVVSGILGMSSLIIFSYFIFFLTTSSLSFHTFILQSVHTASMYSEMMALDTWGSGIRESHYLLGVATSIVFVVGHYWIGKLKNLAEGDRLALLMTGLLCGFIMFRAAYVRADGHVWKLHETMYFGLSIIAACILSRSDGPKRRLGYPVIAYTGVLMAFFILPSLFYSERVDSPCSLSDMIKTGGYNSSQNLVAEIRKQVPDLAEELRKRSGQNGKNRIAFIPWEMMFVSLIDGWKLAGIPSLQIYSENQIKESKSLVQSFLSDVGAPDLIVVGNGAIDGRNPVAEASNWIEPLLCNYRFVGKYDEYALMERREKIICPPSFVSHDAGPGILIHLSTDKLDSWHSFLFRLTNIMFKAPELKVDVAFVDGNNAAKSLAFKSSQTQLENGILFYNGSLTDLLVPNSKISSMDNNNLIKKVEKAQVSIKSGSRNFPVVPDRRELKIKYITLSEVFMSRLVK